MKKGIRPCQSVYCETYIPTRVWLDKFSNAGEDRQIIAFTSDGMTAIEENPYVQSCGIEILRNTQLVCFSDTSLLDSMRKLLDDCVRAADMRGGEKSVTIRQLERVCDWVRVWGVPYVTTTHVLRATAKVDGSSVNAIGAYEFIQNLCWLGDCRTHMATGQHTYSLGGLRLESENRSLRLKATNLFSAAYAQLAFASGDEQPARMCSVCGALYHPTRADNTLCPTCRKNRGTRFRAAHAAGRGDDDE